MKIAVLGAAGGIGQALGSVIKTTITQVQNYHYMILHLLHRCCG